ncbi:glycosyltransferase [Frigoribacterium sp. UYMn621]|uniref:glycosyltransferase n=1 Tax=Frigoribacterium sp. UYMn621 TaxID=3156343 RepID=UPI0033970C4B
MKRVIRLIRQLLRLVGGASRAELQAFARRGGVRAEVVLYESFAGNGVLCNPEAIFREILRSPDLAHLHHIWALDSLREHRAVQAEFAADRRVRFVRRRSLAYVRALATSRYLVNNATFPAEFSKRPGQVYLNTWHGTPLKRMGYDMPNGALDSANTMRNFVAADFLLSQNPFMTEQMYEKAYRLRGAFRGLVIEAGYPRVDRQFLGAEEVIEVRCRLEAEGIPLGDRSVILFAPTWKGTDFSSPADDANELFELVQEIQKQVGPAFLVLLKTHQVVHRFARDRPEFREILVSNDLPTNLMLGITDVLITDYSSIFFDFLPLERPVVFFTPDDLDYSASRGLYFPLDELPGPVVAHVSELGEAIRSSIAAKDPGVPGVSKVSGVSDVPEAQSGPAARSTEWKARFSPEDDGGAARRVVDVVFRGKTDRARTRSLADDPRTSMLLSIGGMRSNGITNSALNLLAAIDHDAYNVSVVFNRPRRSQQLSNQQRIPHQVRQFLRVGGMNGSKATHVFRRLQERYPVLRRRPETAIEQRMWRSEWARCFGDTQFDSVVEFSGYTAFWASLLLHSPRAFRSIWLHNDLFLETRRFVGSRRRMKRSLPAVFSVYRDFDALVSVSESLNKINRDALGTRYALPEEAFVFARNLVDETYVLQGLRAPLSSIEEFDADEAAAQGGARASSDRGWIDGMLRDDDTVWFVSVGRFSPEKNQARLIRAFSEISRETPAARLVIVGHGPLRDHLQRLIDSLALSEVAFIVGPFANPFPILAAADCFVLSSDYEGQPMVLLEAALAGLPIVSVEFDSARDALPDSPIRIVPQSDSGLADGMRAFLRGEVAAAALDGVAYNRSALAEFCAVASPHPKAQRISS